MLRTNFDAVRAKPIDPVEIPRLTDVFYGTFPISFYGQNAKRGFRFPKMFTHLDKLDRTDGTRYSITRKNSEYLLRLCDAHKLVLKNISRLPKLQTWPDGIGDSGIVPLRVCPPLQI